MQLHTVSNRDFGIRNEMSKLAPAAMDVKEKSPLTLYGWTRAIEKSQFGIFYFTLSYARNLYKKYY